MTLRRWLYVGGAGLALSAASFAAGRYSGPTKTRVETKVETKTVTQVEWRDRVVEKRVEGPVREVERIVETPGAERVVTRWIERGPVSTDTSSDASGQSTGTTASTATTLKVTERARPGWAVGVAATWDPRALTSATPERVGLELDRRLLGTIWLGARATAKPDFGAAQVGLALRMEF